MYTKWIIGVWLLVGWGEVEGAGLTIRWKDNYLTIAGEQIPGREIQVHYLEAYCRANSHTTDWVQHTVVPHTTTLVAAREDQRQLELRCRVADGLIVTHRITAAEDEVDFQITAHNPTVRRSQVHWAQPCIRVGTFCGLGAEQTDDPYAYIRKSFVFLDGQLERMPTRDWATQARYVPGQVWAAPGVPAADVNPRPLNPHRPSNGLIGCFSGDERWIFAVAFAPYQELFQGVIRCLHSDFRLGGLKPGETRKVQGKIYIVPNDVPALLRRYAEDFPQPDPQGTADRK